MSPLLRGSDCLPESPPYACSSLPHANGSTGQCNTTQSGTVLAHPVCQGYGYCRMYAALFLSFLSLPLSFLPLSLSLSPLSFLFSLSLSLFLSLPLSSSLFLSLPLSSSLLTLLSLPLFSLLSLVFPSLFSLSSLFTLTSLSLHLKNDPIMDCPVTSHPRLHYAWPLFYCADCDQFSDSHSTSGVLALSRAGPGKSGSWSHLAFEICAEHALCGRAHARGPANIRRRSGPRSRSSCRRAGVMTRWMSTGRALCHTAPYAPLGAAAFAAASADAACSASRFFSASFAQ